LLVEDGPAPVEHAVTRGSTAHKYQTVKSGAGGSQIDIAQAIQRLKGKTMLDHLTRIFTVASLSATLLCAAVPLAAAETRSIAVQSGDLNLAKAADRATLQLRIAHAVDRICSPDHARTTAEAQASQTCEKTARANAASQYDTMIARAQAGTKLAGGRKEMPSAE
jgi:UrcA family protein